MQEQICWQVSFTYGCIRYYTSGSEYSQIQCLIIKRLSEITDKCKNINQDKEPSSQQNRDVKLHFMKESSKDDSIFTDPNGK